jgi:hypothetical protein
MMHTRSTSAARHAISALALGLGLGLSAFAAMAANASTAANANSDIETRYRIDVERCNAGQTNQDKATCLREAGAARDEARRNRLNNGNQSYSQNETARCQALPTDQRDECLLQMSGKDTTTQGSVGAGGVLRETTIVVPGTPAPAAGTVPGTTSPVPSAVPSPGLTPNAPATVPNPSLSPTTPATPMPMSPATPASPNAPATAPVPGTGLMK